MPVETMGRPETDESVLSDSAIDTEDQLKKMGYNNDIGSKETTEYQPEVGTEIVGLKSKIINLEQRIVLMEPIIKKLLADREQLKRQRTLPPEYDN